jgi:hypothetical protein
VDFYDFKVGVSGVFEMNVQSDYVYYLDGAVGTVGADNGIVIQNQSGSRIPLKPGQAAKLGRSSQYDTKWYVVNRKKEGEITGTLLIGDSDDFTDNRISGAVEIIGTVGVVGTVDVVDGNRKRSKDGIAFMGYNAIGASAGNYGQVQLWNPPGSGKNLIVGAITPQAVANQTFIASTASIDIGGANVVPAPKMAGHATPSVAGIRAIATAALPARVVNSNMMVQAYNPQPYRFIEPIIVPPGRGLMLNTGSVNQECFCTFEWFEEPV